MLERGRIRFGDVQFAWANDVAQVVNSIAEELTLLQFERYTRGA